MSITWLSSEKEAVTSTYRNEHLKSVPAGCGIVSDWHEVITEGRISVEWWVTDMKTLQRDERLWKSEWPTWSPKVDVLSVASQSSALRLLGDGRWFLYLEGEALRLGSSILPPLGPLTAQTACIPESFPESEGCRAPLDVAWQKEPRLSSSVTSDERCKHVWMRRCKFCKMMMF